jgi:hypothetical protein
MLKEEVEKKINFKIDLKKPKSTRVNLQNL